MEIDVLQFDEKVGLGTFYPWLAGMDYSIQVWRCDLQQLPPAGRCRPTLLLGGFMGVNDRQRFPYLQSTADWLRRAVDGGLPVLAICLGGQLLAHALGAKVHSQQRQERGVLEISQTEAGMRDPLLAGLPNPFVSFAWHSDSFELPAGAAHLARTAACPGQLFRYRNAWGLQFHPEVDERVISDWIRRSGRDAQPLADFKRNEDLYFAYSRQLLENFLQFASEQRPSGLLASCPDLLTEQAGNDQEQADERGRQDLLSDQEVDKQ